MEDSEFYNLSAEEQTKALQAQAAAVVNQLTNMHHRLMTMGATARAMDIDEAITYVNGAVDG